jgi:hypothetical protein
MFNLFKKKPDPDRQFANELKSELNLMLRIPVELLATTANACGDAFNALARANVKTGFDAEVFMTEVSAYHIRTALVTMNRTAGFDGDAADRQYRTGETFLVKSIREILADQESKGIDTAMLYLMTADKTLTLASAYYARDQRVLQVSHEDVLNFGRNYNPKILSIEGEGLAHSAFIYIIRAIRITHVENLLSREAKIGAVAALNDVLARHVLDLETKVEKLALK